MKVLGLSGSMRKEGNTAQLIKVILQRCEEGGSKLSSYPLQERR